MVTANFSQIDREVLPKRDLTYQNLCPDHLRNFFIAKLSPKTFQENYTDGAQTAGSIRKDKRDFFDYYIFDIGMHLPEGRDVVRKTNTALVRVLLHNYGLAHGTGVRYSRI